MLRQGGDPGSTVAQAGARLARDRGGDDVASATWACACLAYAVGALDAAVVHRYRTARWRSALPAAPPPLPPPPAAPPPPPEQEPDPRPVGGRWLVPVLLVVALVAATTVAVLAAQRLGGADETTGRATPSGTPTSSESNPTDPTPTVTPPATPPTTTPGPTPVAATVEYTCGSTGDGDCFLSERVEPQAATELVRNHDEGTTVSVECQVLGQSVSSSVLDRSSRVWARTSRGGYVAAIFLRGIDKFRVTTPC